MRLEAFSDNSGKLQLSLQEIIEWLTAKDEELSEQLPIGGDVGAVQHQRDFHQVTWATTQRLCAANALYSAQPQVIKMHGVELHHAGRMPPNSRMRSFRRG